MIHYNKKIKIKIKAQAFLSMLLFILLSLIIHSPVMAQQISYELSISGGGAYSFFNHSRSSTSNSLGYSLDAELGFTCFIRPLWGIHIGAGFDYYNVQTKLNMIKHITPGKYDSNNYAYELHTTYFGYKESQQAMFLTIPVMVQFQSTRNQDFQLKKRHRVGIYATTGVKVGLLVKNNYQPQVARLYNAAYYPFFNNWLDTQTFAGLGNFDGNSSSRKQSFNVLAIYTLEAGCKLLVSKSLFLYVGVYYDCGLHDPLKKIRKPLGYYADVENLANFTLLSFAKRVNYMAIGLKVRLAFTPDKKRTLPCPS